MFFNKKRKTNEGVRRIVMLLTRGGRFDKIKGNKEIRKPIGIIFSCIKDERMLFEKNLKE